MTVTFDHRDAGTAEPRWSGLLAGLPTLRLPELPLVVLAAHPDDETLGAGGLIHQVAAAGRPVEVVVASDGEASHPRSPTHRPVQLARTRRRELRAAVRALAPRAGLSSLGLPDGALGAHRPELVAALAARLREPALLVTPWSGDAHPDHDACAAAGTRACAARPGSVLWQYPIWAWHWAGPETLPIHGRLGRLDLDDADRAAKRTAVACHASQHRPLSDQPGDEAILPPAMLAHFERDCEAFVTGDAPASRPAYFEALYREHDDPWDLAGRFYETRKRELLLASLPRPRFRRAFEPGCSGGLLTAQLAPRCDRLLACDVAGRAVDIARARLGALRGVRVEHRRIPDQWPAGSFDLIVLSEVGYYCPDPARLAERVDATLAADGVLAACHWRHPAPDHPLTAEQVHAALGARLRRVASHVEEDFLLDVWTRDGASVARTTGVLP